MWLRFSLYLACLLMSCGASAAEILTAVCGPLQGYVLGVGGASDVYKPIEQRDGMSGQTTIVWEIGSSEAQIIAQGQVGGSPMLEKAVVTLSTKDQVSFVVIYPVSVFLYSLFPQRNALLLSRHTHQRGFDFDAARMLALHGPCTIRIK